MSGTMWCGICLGLLGAALEFWRRARLRKLARQAERRAFIARRMQLAAKYPAWRVWPFEPGE